MKRSEIKEGVSYTNRSGTIRKILTIHADRLHTVDYVVTRNGNMVPGSVREGMERSCSTDSFATWATARVAEAVFTGG